MVSESKSLLIVGAGLAVLFLLRNGIARKTGQQVAAETKRAGRHATDALDDDRTRFLSSVRFGARRGNSNRNRFMAPLPRPDVMVMK